MILVFKIFLKVVIGLKFLLDESLPNRQALIEIDHERSLGEEDSNDVSVLSGRVSKEIIESGTKISVAHLKTTRPNRKENVTELRVEQDLYKNLFGRDTRLKKRALKDEEEIVRIQFLEDYEKYLSTILAEYLDYQKAYLDKKLADFNLSEAKRFYKSIKNKKLKKIASQTDLDKRNLQLLLRKEAVFIKKTEVEKRWKKIEKIIGQSKTKAPSRNLFSKIFEHYRSQGSQATSTEKMRAFKIAELKSGIAKKNLTLAKREKNPSLSLLAGYDIDNSERFSSTTDRNGMVVGFKLKIPIGDTQGSAKVKSAAYNVSKAKIALSLRRLTIETEMNELGLKIKELQKRKDLTSNKIKVSKKILGQERRRYGFGKVSLDDVISLESNYTRYQFQKQSEELELGKKLLSWLALNDKLLEIKEKL